MSATLLRNNKDVIQIRSMVFASVDTVFQNATPTLFDKKGERAESTHDWDENVRKGSI